ncbi:MAG: M20/M25/M40 family metallo-hydrolase, partial [Phycisphaerales bacterium]|nr:M20/M25/M40 family metallo-hydrolase [Phycisphaerales bacterium]
MHLRSHRYTTAAITTLAGLAVALGGCSTTNSTTSNTTSNRSASNASDQYAMVDGQRVDVPDIQMGDQRSINALINQGQNHSEVMDILRVYVEDHGPRLTGSSNLEASQRWARDQLADWGLSNARLHNYGTVATRFDRGPSTGKVLLQSNDPEIESKELHSMEFSTLSWTTGTDGPVTGHVMSLPESMSQYQANSGNYAGAWVMLTPNYSGKGGIRSTGFMMRDRMDERHEIRQGTTQEHAPIDTTDTSDTPVVEGVQWKGSFTYNTSKLPTTLILNETDQGIEGSMAIEGFAEAPMKDASRDGNILTFEWTHSMGTSNITITFDGDHAFGVSVSASSGKEYPIEFDKAGSQAITDEELAKQDRRKTLAAVLAENPAGFISSSKDERVWTTSANEWLTRPASDYPIDIEVNVRQSDHDFINARINEGLDIQIEFDLDHKITAGPIPVYNVIAEIPGSEFPDESIIISAHIDSWDGPGSKGAVDNGTGTAVVTEAARILMESGVQPKRTIIIALWGGEEQGLMGSKAYVDSLTEEQLAKVSAMFVDDGGTNYQGGIPTADFMVDYLAAASAPTNGLFFSQTD